ncbi:MAG TPA: radical SAM protein [Candidatus Nanoarchaeia archaeon]|nr:radical SAM protein [Candidatus Nanoarchaeia archaeon]
MNAMLLIPPSRYSNNVARDLLWGCWCKGKRIAAAEFPNVTILQMSTMMKEKGHEVTIVDSTAEKYTFDDVERIVEEKQPEAIFVPSATMSFKEDASTLKDLKELVKGKCYGISYGAHATFLREKALEEPGVDITLLHEHEFSALEVLDALQDGKELDNIKGIGFKRNGAAVMTERREWTSLDELPIADRTPIWDYIYFNPQVKRVPWTTMLTSKGCPARCNFCTTPSFYGNTWRGMSPKRVVDEMEYLANRGYKEIFFRDETWTGNFRRTDEICNMIIECGLEKRLTWICSSRVNTLKNEEQVRLMKRAGCHMLRFGVESGDNQILKNINKSATVEQCERTFEWCRKAGIETHAHTMLGSVGETWETVHKTIAFLKKIQPTTVTCGAYTPYPGTPIFEEVRQKDASIGDGTSAALSLHNKGYYSHHFSKLSEEEVGKAVRLLYKEFYLRPRYMMKTLLRMRSLSEFRRAASAGMQVLSYVSHGEGEE